MKTKSMLKKLRLNKATVANLDDAAMKRLNGGYIIGDPEPQSQEYVSACMGKYTCIDSRCLIYTCTCDPQETPMPTVNG